MCGIMHTIDSTPPYHIEVIAMQTTTTAAARQASPAEVAAAYFSAKRPLPIDADDATRKAYRKLQVKARPAWREEV